jgi:hypothetical protein
MTQILINQGFKDTTIFSGLVRSTLIPHFSVFLDILDFPTWISADTKINDLCHFSAHNPSFLQSRISLHNNALRQNLSQFFARHLCQFLA